MTNRPAPNYPQFEKLFEPGAAEAALRRVERTRKQLNEMATRATAVAERDRARAAYDAFTRALALVREVSEVRQKLAEEATAAGTAR